jgi:hypothetical protein
MQTKMMAVSNWFAADPNRIRAVRMTVAGVLTLLALLFPELAALADPEATGGSS